MARSMVEVGKSTEFLMRVSTHGVDRHASD